MLFVVDSMNSSRSRTNYHSVFGQRLGAFETNNSTVPDPGESKYAGLAHVTSTSASSPWSTDSAYASIDSFNCGPSGTNMRRSRPSFLDSINIPKGPSVPPLVPLSEPVRDEPFGSKVFPEDRLGSSDLENPMNSISASEKGGDLFKQDNKQELYSRKQDEDFAALEQVFAFTFNLWNGLSAYVCICNLSWTYLYHILVLELSCLYELCWLKFCILISGFCLK